MNILKVTFLLVSLAGSICHAMGETLLERQEKAIVRLHALEAKIRTRAVQKKIKHQLAEIDYLEKKRNLALRTDAILAGEREKRFETSYPIWRELENEKERLEKEALIGFRKANPIALEKAIESKEAAIAESQNLIAAWKRLNVSKSTSDFMTSRHEENIRNRSIELQRLYNELAPIRAYIRNTDQEIGAIQYQQGLLDN